jgi:cobalt-zinc-cadmium efflux system outer membrane protein
MRWRLSSLILAALWGCTGPGPEPLDPALSESEFRARTLEDPGLRNFVESNPGARPSPFPPTSWDLASLTLAAFYFHPELDLARARVSQGHAGLTTAQMWPNPVVTADLEHVAKVEPGLKPWIYGLSLSLPVDTLWKRGYKIEEAERLSDVARLGLAETGWRVRSRVRAALAEHLFSLRELDLRRQEEVARSDVVTALERKLALGDIFRLDVDVAQGDLFTSRSAVRTAEGRVAESRAALASAIGVPHSALKGKTFAWPELDQPPPPESLSIEQVQTAGLLNRLDVRGLLAEYDAAEAALKRELSARYPDVSVGPGYLYDQGQRKYILGLSVTLPVLNQNEGPIAEALARRKEVAARFHALQASVIGEAESALERYQSAIAELGEADRTLATLDRREKATRRAIELKDLDKTALTGLRLETVQAQEGRLGSLKRGEEALGALEDAVQRPLGSRRAPPEAGPSSPREKEGN